MYAKIRYEVGANDISAKQSKSILISSSQPASKLSDLSQSRVKIFSVLNKTSLLTRRNSVSVPKITMNYSPQIMHYMKMCCN